MLGISNYQSKAKSEEYRVSHLKVTSTPISNVPIGLFPDIEIDLNLNRNEERVGRG